MGTIHSDALKQVFIQGAPPRNSAESKKPPLCRATSLGPCFGPLWSARSGVHHCRFWGRHRNDAECGHQGPES